MISVAKGKPNMSTIRNYADYRAALANRRNLSGDAVLDGLKSYIETVRKIAASSLAPDASWANCSAMAPARWESPA